MKINVPDPSLQITTQLDIVEKLTSKDPLFRHRLHAVITENNLHGLVRQRQTLEFWSYLVAEVTELEVVIAGDVRAAAMIQRDAKKNQTWAKSSARISRVTEDADKGLVSKQACEAVAQAMKVLQLWQNWTSSKRLFSTKANTRERNDREKRLPETKGRSGLGSGR